MPSTNHKPFLVFILLFLLLLTGLPALWGGLALMADPSGNTLELSSVVLQGTIFNDFLIPGIILFLFVGIFSSFVFFSMLHQPEWKWANFLNIYKEQNWTWTYCLYLGVILTIWIDVQILMIGYVMQIQMIYAFIGISIIVFSLMPSVKNYYQVPPQKKLYRNIIKEYKIPAKYKDLVL